jgi:serine/threonine-protein kinase HipA
VADDLAIWMYEQHVANVFPERNRRMRLGYSDTALRTYPLGSPVLSLSLPLTPERYPNAISRAFLDGLLPEEESRRVIAQDLNLNANDTYGLIQALGRDCAGALVFQPSDELVPPPASTTTAELMTDTAIGELIVNLRSAPLGVSRRVRVSLAGAQEKALLTRMPDGSWGLPVDGTPSTHLFKPEIRDYPLSVENEAFCMRFVRHLNLAVPHVETAEYGDRKVLIVERFDRTVSPDGRIERIHQEDFCQATGRGPEKKYEENGGPSLRTIAETIRAVANPDSSRRFLQALVVNVLVGNGDAHGKNFSLFHHRDGSLELTPLYDVMSTLYYGLDELAMCVDNIRKIDRITGDRLVNEVASWGMPRESVIELVTNLLDAVPDAVAQAAIETPGLPPQIPDLVRSQLANLRVGLNNLK